MVRAIASTGIVAAVTVFESTTTGEGVLQNPSMTGTTEVLVLAPRFPLPLVSGTQIREYHVLRALADRYDVTLVSLVQDSEGSDHVTDVEAFADVHTVAHSRSQTEALCRFALSAQPYRLCKLTTPAFRARVREVLAAGSFDLVWANFLNIAAAVPEDGPPLILDEHNSDVRYWESFLDGSLSERAMARLNIRRVRRLRQQMRNHIDGVVSVSEVDAAKAREWAGDPVWTIPNGVETKKFVPLTTAASAGKRVMFVGSLNVRMNEEAVEWFAREAWPIVREAHPDATFAVVGRNPTDRVKAATDTPGVDLVGEVPSVVPHYDRAAVAVAPFQFGGGTKLKVLEALSMARPLVTTPVGATGIPVTDGDEAMVRERDGSFATTVADLLASPEEQDTLGTRARSFVQRKFAWDVLTDRGIKQVVGEVLSE